MFIFIKKSPKIDTTTSPPEINDGVDDQLLLGKREIMKENCGKEGPNKLKYETSTQLLRNIHTT